MNLIIKRTMDTTIDSKKAYEIASVNSEKKADQLFDYLMREIKKTSENGIFYVTVQDITYFTDRVRKKLEDLGYKVVLFDYHGVLKISWNEHI